MPRDVQLSPQATISERAKQQQAMITWSEQVRTSIEALAAPWLLTQATQAAVAALSVPERERDTVEAELPRLVLLLVRNLTRHRLGRARGRLLQRIRPDFRLLGNMDSAGVLDLLAALASLAQSADMGTLLSNLAGAIEQILSAAAPKQAAQAYMATQPSLASARPSAGSSQALNHQTPQRAGAGAQQANPNTPSPPSGHDPLAQALAESKRYRAAVAARHSRFQGAYAARSVNGENLQRILSSADKSAAVAAGRVVAADVRAARTRAPPASQKAVQEVRGGPTLHPGPALTAVAKFAMALLTPPESETEATSAPYTCLIRALVRSFSSSGATTSAADQRTWISLMTWMLEFHREVEQVRAKVAAAAAAAAATAASSAAATAATAATAAATASEAGDATVAPTQATPPARQYPFGITGVAVHLDGYTFKSLLQRIANSAHGQDLDETVRAVSALRQVLATLLRVYASTDSACSALALVLQHSVFYSRELADIMPMLLSDWKPKLWPREYLADLVTAAAAMLRIVEGLTKKGLTVRRRFRGEDEEVAAEAAEWDNGVEFDLQSYQRGFCRDKSMRSVWALLRHYKVNSVDENVAALDILTLPAKVENLTAGAAPGADAWAAWKAGGQEGPPPSEPRMYSLEPMLWNTSSLRVLQAMLGDHCLKSCPHGPALDAFARASVRHLVRAAQDAGPFFFVDLLFDRPRQVNGMISRGYAEFIDVPKARRGPTKAQVAEQEAADQAAAIQAANDAAQSAGAAGDELWDGDMDDLDELDEPGIRDETLLAKRKRGPRKQASTKSKHAEHSSGTEDSDAEAAAQRRRRPRRRAGASARGLLDDSTGDASDSQGKGTDGGMSTDGDDGAAAAATRHSEPWTESEDAALKEKWPGVAGMRSAATLLSLLPELADNDRSAADVRKRVRQLGLTKQAVPRAGGKTTEGTTLAVTRATLKVATHLSAATIPCLSWVAQHAAIAAGLASQLPGVDASSPAAPGQLQMPFMLVPTGKQHFHWLTLPTVQGLLKAAGMKAPGTGDRNNWCWHWRPGTPAEVLHAVHAAIVSTGDVPSRIQQGITEKAEARTRVLVSSMPTAVLQLPAAPARKSAKPASAATSAADAPASPPESPVKPVPVPVRRRVVQVESDDGESDHSPVVQVESTTLSMPKGGIVLSDSD